MTRPAPHTAPINEATARTVSGNATLPAIGAVVLAVLWGAYTILFIVELALTSAN